MIGRLCHFYNTESFNLGDQRLNARAYKILDQLSTADLQKGFPRIFAQPAQLKAFYRFVNNSRIQVDSIIAGSRRALTDYFNQRLQDTPSVGARPVLLPCYQDTSFIDYTDRFHVRLGRTQGKSKRENSALLHTLICCNEKGTPVGILHQDFFVRPPEVNPRTVPHYRRPFVERESYKWVRGLDAVQLWASQLARPVQPVIVADREADSIDVITAHQQRGLDFIIRSKADRKVSQTPECAKLHEAMRRSPSLKQGVVKRRLHSRSAKRYYHADCVVRYGSVQLTAGGQCINVVYLHEQPQSRDDDKVKGPAAEWFLLTSLASEDLDQAIRQLDLYTQRWPVTEDFHKVLKTGARIEHRQFESRQGLANTCALLSVTAVRILGLRYLAEQQPDTPVGQTAWGREKYIEGVMDKLDAKYLTPRDRDFSKPRTVKRLLQIMARMGGHQGYAQKGRPGWQTLWLGDQDLVMILSVLDEF